MKRFDEKYLLITHVVSLYRKSNYGGNEKVNIIAR